jgi:hypothetical protein
MVSTAAKNKLMSKARFILFFLLVAQAAYAQTPIRIACGQSTPYTDSSGNVWSTDAGFFNTGNTFTTTRAIAGTPDPTLYQHERWSAVGWSNGKAAMVYTIPTPSGAWTVNLYFSENFVTAVGQRIFNVKINGNPFLTNFDIFFMAGGQFTANMQSSTIISTGTVTIEFDHVSPAVQNPQITAIELLPITAGENVLTAKKKVKTSGDKSHGAR